MVMAIHEFLKSQQNKIPCMQVSTNMFNVFKPQNFVPTKLIDVSVFRLCEEKLLTVSPYQGIVYVLVAQEFYADPSLYFPCINAFSLYSDTGNERFVQLINT